MDLNFNFCCVIIFLENYVHDTKDFPGLKVNRVSCISGNCIIEVGIASLK